MRAIDSSRSDGRRRWLLGRLDHWGSEKRRDRYCAAAASVVLSCPVLSCPVLSCPVLSAAVPLLAVAARSYVHTPASSQEIPRPVSASEEIFHCLSLCFPRAIIGREGNRRVSKPMKKPQQCDSASIRLSPVLSAVGKVAWFSISLNLELLFCEIFGSKE